MNSQLACWRDQNGERVRRENITQRSERRIWGFRGYWPVAFIPRRRNTRNRQKRETTNNTAERRLGEKEKEKWFTWYKTEEKIKENPKTSRSGRNSRGEGCFYWKMPIIKLAFLYPRRLKSRCFRAGEEDQADSELQLHEQINVFSLTPSPQVWIWGN